MPTGRAKTASNPKGAGAPTKRTDERRERILVALRAGGTRRAACGAAGISDQLMLDWMRDSVEFLDAVQMAEAECELTMTAAIIKAAATDWHAALVWLERRRGRDFGRRQTVELDLRVEAQRLAQEFGLDPAEIVAEAERIAARQVASDDDAS